MLRSSCASKTPLIHLVTVIGIIFSTPIWAQEPEVSPASVDTALPPIEARVYDLEVVRPSASGRVYLLKKAELPMPDLGRIFLLREGATPAMGFRVLKVYPEKLEVAAKKVKEYPGQDRLPEASTYRAYEKIGDILSVPPQTAEDVEDLNELENGASPSPSPDPDEDADSDAEEQPAPSPSPSPSASLSPEPTSFSAEEEVTELDEKFFREEALTDYFPNWTTFEAGLVRHGKLPGGTYQRGFGVLYGRNISQNVFRDSSDYPDSFTIEGGFYYFKTNSIVDEVSKSYTMLPLKAQFRYTVPTSEKFALYFYGGLIYHYVASHVNATDDELAQMAIVAPALGAGGLIQFGPNWHIKLNLGLDTLAAGVVLRF